MPSLLVSLGTSSAIVPEAFLLPEIAFNAVHVLTTDSTDVAFVEQWFALKVPDVELSITRVDGFKDFKSEQDHFNFEEVLYRWWLEKAAGSRPYVCLAGGFKTMSSAMQKAAAVLGAAEVFHVLADSMYPGSSGKLRPAMSAEEIAHSLDQGHLHWIRLGPESGWPHLREAAASDYPLQTIRQRGVVTWVVAPDLLFHERLQSVFERSHNVAGAWDRLAGLPFAVLATWPAQVLARLEEPVNVDVDRAWIASLPKVELHCHLGGFATHGEALQNVRAAAVFPDRLPPLHEPTPPEGWPVPATPVRLEEYMRLGDANGRVLLRDPGCLRRQCELLYDHLCAQNIVYAEIRCSPNNYTSPDRSAWDVLAEIRSAFDARMSAVAASVPLDRTVTASVPLEGMVTAAVPAADSHSPRAFIPFNREAKYGQTWRDLPHRYQSGATVFATFRLADSLPRAAIERWAEEREYFMRVHPKPWDEKTWSSYRHQFPERLDAWLDEAQGECLLRDERVAAMVESALRHFDGIRYVLDGFVIMPNHVHVLFKPLAGHEMRGILHSWKSFTAKQINKLIGRISQVWEHESFDHLLRSASQLQKLREYVRSNPEMAGLSGGFVVGMGVGLECGMLEEEQSLRRTGSAPGSQGEMTLQVPDFSALAVSSCAAPAGGLAIGAPPRPSQRLGSTDESSRRLAPTVNLIIIATRKDGGDRSDISRHLALAMTAADQWKNGCRVVGVDLAGWEKPETRAALFATDFEPVHRVGLAVTVHAGENDDAEGIWQAVFKLNARRLGHALHLNQSPDLRRAVADRGIGVEMCPFANLQIKGFALSCDDSRPAYPMRQYLQSGVSVTVNTDNIGISAATLTDNLLLAARMCPDLTRMDIIRLMANAVNVSFVSPDERSELRRRIEQFLVI
jgi:adenosine deaminase/REP element-mobilizing transposase RayT